MATKKRLPQTDQEWLETAPDASDIGDSPTGGKHIPIEKLRPLLDRLNCSFINYNAHLVNPPNSPAQVAGMIELVAIIDGKQRVVTGAYNLEIDKAIGGFWNGTLKSECVKNAAAELGKRLGRGLNISEGVVSGEVRKTGNKLMLPDEKIVAQYFKAIDENDEKTISTLKGIYQFTDNA